MLIGISARKLGGKTTSSSIIKRYIDSSFMSKEVEIVSFATKLKQIVIDCFTPREWGLTVELLDHEECKNRITPCGLNIRKLLQVVGTDFFRSTYEDVWVKSLFDSIEPGKKIHIISDVRFENEVFAVQERGGMVIRLLRSPQAKEDQHRSEMGLDELEEKSILFHQGENVEFGKFKPFDLVIDNREMTIDQLSDSLKSGVCSHFGLV